MNSGLNLALSIDSNIRRADPTTIKNKFLVGYQGWFYCHGDGEPVGPGHHGWIHWFTHPVPNGGALNTDYWPDMSQYSREELFIAPGFKHRDGSPAYLFSSRNPKTVQRHFHWMAEKGVDGVFLQRFLGLCDIARGGNDGNRRIRDEVGDSVKRAAEREGRVYAIMYDVTGVQPERIQEVIEEDWRHLIREKRVLNSPNYLREDGKPVVAIWGLGFEGRKHTPDQVRALTSFFRNSTPGGAYLMAGTPAHWRTSDSDADHNPEFVDTWLESFDAISPWTVGRYSDLASADAFADDRIQGDVMYIAGWAMNHGRRVDYVPVVHPGSSGFNMSNGQWPRNAAPREGGRFLWRQIYNARKLGARIMYGAMWDEYDEGTQFLPAIMKTTSLPVDESHRYTLISYDIDGYDVPPDWYMRIAGYGSSLVKDERFIEDQFPEKDLRDWETKYEARPSLQSLIASGSGRAGPSGHGQLRSSMARLRRVEAGDEDDPPPPPYSPNAEVSSGVNTIPSRGPEPPVTTRPETARRDSQPPPPIPPRPSSQPSHSHSPSHGPGVPPAIPLRSRPSVSSTTRPRSPDSFEPGPSPTTYHGQSHPTPHHLSATQPAPMQSSYPNHMPLAQSSMWPQYHDPTGPSQYTAGSPTAQSPMSNYPQLPQPGGPWYPPPGSQPPWPQQGWNYPNPMGPTQFPPPGPPMSPYGYPSGYNEPHTVPDHAHPVNNYPPAMSQPPPILEPQQLNPGPPPPIHPHPSNNSRSEHGGQHAPPHAHANAYTGSARPSSPHMHQPPRAHSPHHGAPPHSPHHGTATHSPLYAPPPHPPPIRRRRSSSSSRHKHTRKDTLIHKLGNVSAAGSNLLHKFTK